MLIMLYAHWNQTNINQNKKWKMWIDLKSEQNKGEGSETEQDECKKEEGGRGGQGRGDDRERRKPATQVLPPLRWKK